MSNELNILKVSKAVICINSLFESVFFNQTNFISDSDKIMKKHLLYKTLRISMTRKLTSVIYSIRITEMLSKVFYNISTVFILIFSITGEISHKFQRWKLWQKPAERMNSKK